MNANTVYQKRANTESVSINSTILTHNERTRDADIGGCTPSFPAISPIKSIYTTLSFAMSFSLSIRIPKDAKTEENHFGTPIIFDGSKWRLVAKLNKSVMETYVECTTVVNSFLFAPEVSLTYHNKCFYDIEKFDISRQQKSRTRWFAVKELDENECYIVTVTIKLEPAQPKNPKIEPLLQAVQQIEATIDEDRKPTLGNLENRLEKMQLSEEAMQIEINNLKVELEAMNGKVMEYEEMLNNKMEKLEGENQVLSLNMEDMRKKMGNSRPHLARLAASSSQESEYTINLPKVQLQADVTNEAKKNEKLCNGAQELQQRITEAVRSSAERHMRHAMELGFLLKEVDGQMCVVEKNEQETEQHTNQDNKVIRELEEERDQLKLKNEELEKRIEELLKAEEAEKPTYLEKRARNNRLAAEIIRARNKKYMKEVEQHEKEPNMAAATSQGPEEINDVSDDDYELL